MSTRSLVGKDDEDADTLPAAPYEEHRCLTLSTAHIRATTNQWLHRNLVIRPLLHGSGGGGRWPILNYGQHDHGWMIAVRSLPSDENIGKLPHDLLEVIEWARSNGAYWLDLDADADECSDLTRYDW